MKRLLLILCLATLVTGLGITSSGGGYSQHAKADWVNGNTTFTRISGGSQPVASWNQTNLCGRFGVITAIGCPGVVPAPTPAPAVAGGCTQLCSDEEWLWFIYDRSVEIGTRLLDIIPGFKR